MHLRLLITLTIFYLLFFCSIPNSGGAEKNIGEVSIIGSPSLEFKLPNGIVNVAFQQETPKFNLFFESQNGFLIDNYIFTNVDFRYNFPKYFIGSIITDRLDYQKPFSNTNVLQGNRIFMPNFGTTLLKVIEIRSSIKFENTFTVSDSTGSAYMLDRGRNIQGLLTFIYSTLKESPKAPSGIKTEFIFMGPIASLGSDYDYTRMEFNFSKYIHPFGKHFLRIDSKIGYPVSTVNMPLSSLYYIGGPYIMNGYRNNEFYGNSLMYLKLGYHVPLRGPVALGKSLNIFTTDLYYESAKIGNADIFDNLKDFKSSFGVGFALSLIFFDKVDVKFSLLSSQAHEERQPTFYFTLTAVKYTQKQGT